MHVRLACRLATGSTCMASRGFKRRGASSRASHARRQGVCGRWVCHASAYNAASYWPKAQATGGDAEWLAAAESIGCKADGLLCTTAHRSLMRVRRRCSAA